jgi:aminopeptidase N
MKILILLFTVLIPFLSTTAQEHNCGISNQANNIANFKTSGTGQNIDVVYHRMYWRMNPDTVPATYTRPVIKGTVTTYFKTTAANVSTINFDLIKSSFQAGLVVKYHGSTITHSFPSSGNVDILNITLPAIIPTIGTLDSVTIEYGGQAIVQSGEAYGAVRSGSNAGTTQSSSYYYWTLAESYEDRNFFPCKHDMTDKIDSMLITISCPSAHIGVANGKLISEVTIGAQKEYTYKSTYPTASYLVAFSVGRFNKYSRTPITISGTSVPLTYYRRATMTAANLTSADAVREMMQIFSDKFGDYPFKNDGYGLMEFGFGGGMEHQTMSSMNTASFTGFTINAHELAHQWFGDKLSFSTWTDLWIAEGFAKYLETIAAEFDVSVSTDPIGLRSTIKANALATTSETISVVDITNSNTIWTAANNEIVYKRGAMVVSMLRKLLGDTKFFQACRNMLNHPNHSYRSISTAELKTFFEAESGLNLTEFFNDWIYGKGNPSYAVTWGNFGNKFNVELNQTVTTAGATVTHFSMPVVLKIANAAGTKDTTIVIFDNNNVASNAGNRLTNQLSYNLSFTPSTVTLDPNNDMLANLTGSGSTVTFLASLNANITTITGESKGNYNEIKLTIEKNDRIKDIYIEKSSSLNNFSTLSKILSSSETANLEHFIYKDFNPIKPNSFYRIKFVYQDGSESFSTFVKVTNSITENIKILNNPVIGNNLSFQLNATTLTSGNLIKIYDLNGKLNATKTLIYNNYIGQIDIQKLAAGQYILHITNKQGNPIATTSFLKN